MLPANPSRRIPATSSTARMATRTELNDWNVCPRAQFMIYPQRRDRYGNERRRGVIFAPGSVFLLEDMTGNGHRTRVTAGGWRVLTAAWNSDEDGGTADA